MLKYCFDGYINNRACGWVADLKTPGKKLHVALVVSGEVVSIVEASDHRKDLEEVGYADGRFGFSIPLPQLIEGDCYLRIVEIEKDIKESLKKVTHVDASVSLLYSSKDFSRYVQFVEARSKKTSGNAPKRSRRLSSVMGSCVEQGGLHIPRHAQWAIERHRKGGPNFFSTPTETVWADFAWYIFDYNSADKSTYDIKNDNPLMQRTSTPPFSELSPLYMAWLVRRGAQINDLSSITDKQHCEFLSTLVSAKLSIPNLTQVERLKKLVSRRPRGSKIKNLPRLSKYLSWKHETGYSQNYQIDRDTDYLAYIFDAVIHASGFELEYFGEDVLRFLREEIKLSDGVVSRFELLVWLYAQRLDSPNYTISESIRCADVQQYFHKRWLPAHPQHQGLSAASHTEYVVTSKAISIVAHWDSASGLTQNAIMSAKAFAKAGIKVAKLYPSGEVYIGGEEDEIDVDPAIVVEKNIVILHVNADEAPDALARISATIDLDSSHVIGFYLWELEEVPKAHLLGLDLVDEVWVPTEFVGAAYEKLIPHKVKLVKKALQVPEVVASDRSKFGIPEGSYTFLLSFDYHSCTERKNPVVAVQAFLEAFDKDDDVTLVVKTTDFAPNHWGDPFSQWQAVQALAESDNRIIVIEDFLENDDFFALINSCDAVVSTHRAEGFGYLPAYAIWLGKSVIVTDYSGTRDFCTKDNSYLVDFNLVPVPAAKFIYPMLRPLWAEVIFDSLVEQYKNCRQSVKHVSESERQHIKDVYNFAKLADTYLETLRSSGVLVVQEAEATVEG
ncbi:glycosyltransferase [Pseudomonas shirazica]|uniref:glycosyltransferase n=1 Tax=Pseudomonas shirazica TaxID=1940636 RepID=UPI0034D5D6EB